MEPRVLKNEGEYQTALASVEGLARTDPAPGTPAGDRLELLSLLVEAYEKEHFNIEAPDAISAIRFRMEQAGLSQRDLVPYLGSRAKVSEVLAGKRPLTLSMIRGLHEGLGIPADVLLQSPGSSLPAELPVDWRRFPVGEIVRRGWVDARLDDIADRAEELIRTFLEPGIGQPLVAFHRHTRNVRSAKRMDHHALYAWCVRVSALAAKETLTAKVDRDAITPDFLSEVARLSWAERGPLLAREFLAKHGILVVIEPHLPRTHLDGAALMTPAGTPVIGLTLRHDRLDSFWFTLLHELAHVAKHLSQSEGAFIDDLDFGDSNDPRESEADRMAGEALIPRTVRLNTTRAFRQRTTEAVLELATQLRVHPAIVAGRIRHETRNYRILTQLVGTGEVRKLFGGVAWQ